MEICGELFVVFLLEVGKKRATTASFQPLNKRRADLGIMLCDFKSKALHTQHKMLLFIAVSCINKEETKDLTTKRFIYVKSTKNPAILRDGMII